MTRVEFVRQRFTNNIQDAINSIKDNKGFYSQYIDDPWNHEIKMSFEIVLDRILADIKAEHVASKLWDVKCYELRGWVKIETTLEEALVKLIAYAQKQTGYKSTDFED